MDPTYRYGGNDEEIAGEDDGEGARSNADSHRAQGRLLVEDSGAFCVGPKDKIHKILDVERYIKTWPLIPQAELHASSVQHPDDISMRWLLHSRRVKRKQPVLDSSGVAQPAASLPPSAGVGDKESPVWMCKSCIDHLCTRDPKMPPLALANSMFLGRHHPLFKEATLATRMLASSARLLMRQLFLGRGADDEVHKGTTGNTMLISQPSPSYEQVLPNTDVLTEGLVVLFCKSTEDVSKARVLVVNREEYRAMVHHRKQVCPGGCYHYHRQRSHRQPPRKCGARYIDSGRNPNAGGQPRQDHHARPSEPYGHVRSPGTWRRQRHRRRKQ